jgi:hypothetical protein
MEYGPGEVHAYPGRRGELVKDHKVLYIPGGYDKEGKKSDYEHLFKSFLIPGVKFPEVKENDAQGDGDPENMVHAPGKA